MVEGSLTLGIPGPGSTDFEATPIPSLLISEWLGGQMAVRSPAVGALTVSGYSNWGTANITGPAHGLKYSWAVPTVLEAPHARQLFRLWHWQQTNQAALRLVDEVEPLDIPDGRPLLATNTEAYGTGLTYGFAAFAVWLELPEDWRTHLGVFATGTHAKQVSFTLLEV